MPKVATIGDYCSGHQSYPPRQTNNGSPDVYVNGKGWHRKGDDWLIHCSGHDCHGAKLAEGSSNVFINSQPAGRFGDPLSCGSAVITGSPDVNCGG